MANKEFSHEQANKRVPNSPLHFLSTHFTHLYPLLSLLPHLLSSFSKVNGKTVVIWDGGVLESVLETAEIFLRESFLLSETFGVNVKIKI